MNNYWETAQCRWRDSPLLSVYPLPIRVAMHDAMFPQFHYLIYRSGFQTWEYSPAYALRSYGYIVLHIIPMLLTRSDNKVREVWQVGVSVSPVLRD